MKLDKKDRKILLELDINARQSYGQIASNVGLSKSSVMHRIRKLEENKIILAYVTIIDTMRLGYTTYDIYLKFNNTTPKKEQEIIEYLTKHKKVWFVVSTTGKVELVILISTKTPTEFYSIWDEIYGKIKPFVRIVRTSILIEYIHYIRNYLSPESSVQKKEIYISKLGKETIDDKNNEILKLLSKNARVSILDLSKKTNLTPGSVIYRIKELEKKEIIQGYRSIINFKKLGYEYFKVIVELNDSSIKNDIISWVKGHKNVTYYDGFIGGLDIEFDVEIENIEKFISLLNELKNKFGTKIKEIDYFIPLLFHKSTYYPEE